MAAATRSRRFIQTLDARCVRAPFDKTWWMGFGYVGCSVRSPYAITLTDIWVEERFRNRKVGHHMLEQVTTLADQLGVRIVTWVRPFDPGTKRRRSAEQLTRWYKRHGFEELKVDRRGRRLLHRQPRNI